MKFNLNDMQNMDLNKSMKYLLFLSFVTQWSFLSMIINLFTMGIIRIPLFVLMIIDALTMLKIQNKTIKRPSFILSKIWDLIDIITNHRNTKNYNYGYNDSTVHTVFDRISHSLSNCINKIKNIFNNYNEDKINRKKYDKEREINKFSDEIGKNITIEYTSPDKKLKKKSFKYNDRATTYVNMLESEGYKNYTKYNIDPQTGSTYIVFNKNKDIIDLSANKIQLKHDDKDYKYVTYGWPKK